MKVTFLPAKKEIQVQAGDNLLQVAERANVLIDASCAGAGKCGKCKVKITSGAANPLTDVEMSLLSEFEQEMGYRLACCTTVESDMEVIVPGSHGGSTRKKKITKLPETFVPEKQIASIQLKVPKATMKYQVNDLQRIAEAFEKPNMRVARGLLPRIHKALEKSHGTVTATFRGDELISLEAGKHADACYGVAFDIGTTTVVGMLWDLNTNTLVDVEAKTNYQSVYGADVITRIQFCNAAPNNLALMQEKVVQCFNDILEEIYVRSHILPKNVYDVTVVGNTTMSHLVFGVTPKSMARTPFAPVFCASQNMDARDLGLQVNYQANVHLLPNIAGHVGSDIVGMMLAVGMDSLVGSHIAIDIGTNGEVVAIKDGKMMTCSTAAGPAFEGAEIYQGMRAAAGAIENVTITADDVIIKTIDDMPPIGICGSGLIDAMAQLLDSGIVDKSGRMLSQEEALSAGISQALVDHIVGVDGNLAFMLAHRENEEDIVLTQQDIREVQLAKGAICGGIMTLMKTLGMSVDEIDSILLAGAFGNYISKESALRIGLFPPVPVEKIKSVGNAAGAGSSMALLSESARKHASEMALCTEHVELSMNKDFQEYYTSAMTFDLKAIIL